VLPPAVRRVRIAGKGGGGTCRFAQRSCSTGGRGHLFHSVILTVTLFSYVFQYILVHYILFDSSPCTTSSRATLQSLAIVLKI